MLRPRASERPSRASMLDLKIEDGGDGRALEDHSTSTPGKARLLFSHHDLPSRVSSIIRKYDYVFGCVAWLTHPKILDALTTCKGVSIVVQKEDFLRPDSRSFRRSIREMYDKIRGFERWQLPGLASGLSVCSDPSVDAIRCVGNHNSDRAPAHPRSHHKFLVFCKNASPSGACPKFIPELFWMGSFNHTVNAGRSFESVIVSPDVEMCEQFLKEWAQIFALSEPLDWTSNWCAPEWRLGT